MRQNRKKIGSACNFTRKVGFDLDFQIFYVYTMNGWLDGWIHDRFSIQTNQISQK